MSSFQFIKLTKMMRPLSYNYVVILIVSICGSFRDSYGVNVTIESELKDLQLLVKKQHNVTFSIYNQSSLLEPATIKFEATSNGVVSIHPTSVKVTKNLANFTIAFEATDAGRTTVKAVADNSSAQQVDVKNAFVRFTVQHSKSLDVFSQVIGWIYFVAWSISFYPQIYENWKRKSVIGLSFDFLGLNVVGFTLYSLFNVGLYWITPIQNEYFSRHPTGVNPVQLNDVIFSLHAVFACVVTIFQCFVYERGNQSVSRICKFIFVGIFLFLTISLIVSLAGALKYLDFLYFCSYVKLFITLIKYVPQAYLNFRRKSTFGWSIGNILLDFTGGFLSIGQMFVISYNENDWGSVFGDPTKFGLGLFSVLFDILFILQHYVFYRGNSPAEELIGDDMDQVSNASNVSSDGHA